MAVEKESTTLRSADYQKKMHHFNKFNFDYLHEYISEHFRRRLLPPLEEISPGLSGEDGPLEGTFLGGRGGGAGGKKINALKTNKKQCK